MEFSLEIVKEFREDFKKIIKELEEKYQSTIKLEKITYSESSFSGKLNVTLKEFNGKPFEQFEFERLCKIYGFEKEDYNREVVSKIDNLVLVGFNINSPKNCYLLKDSKGKKFIASTIKFK